MADDSISREKLYDARIVQPPSRYAVSVGGSAITVTPFRSVAATTSQMTFTVNVPSQTVFLDRAVELSTQVTYRFDVRVYATQQTAAQQATNGADPIFVFGKDGALEALPVHGLISTLTCIINDASVTVDLGSTMKELLRLSDFAANRKIRTAPTMLDRYVYNPDSDGAANNPLGGYDIAVADSEVPNGAWWDIEYANPTNGQSLTANPVASYSNTPGQGGVANAATIPVVNGVPRRYASDGAAGVNEAVWQAGGGYYTMAIRFRTQEFLMVSPLVFADSHEESVSIFGVNNLQITANFKADVSRTVRCQYYADAIPATLPPRGRVIGLGAGGPGLTAFGTVPGLYAAQPFNESTLNCTFLSPSVNQKLPTVSMVPWAEYP